MHLEHQVINQATAPSPEEPDCASIPLTDLMTGFSKVLTDIKCPGEVNCTGLASKPGATIVSPLILSLTGTIGQIIALVHLYQMTRPQQTRTVFYTMLSTLIWSDLIGEILTTPPAILSYVSGKWFGGAPMCYYHGFSMMMIGLVTHWLVSAMAVERLIGIRHGYFYSKHVTPSRARLVLFIIWTSSAFFCALPLFGFGRYALQYPGTWCFVDIHICSTSKWHHSLYTNIYGCFNLISLVIIVSCNVMVIAILLDKAMSRANACSGTLSRMRLARSRESSSFCQPHRNRRQRELELQMVILLSVMTVVFIVSWSPLDMRLFFNQIWPHNSQTDHYSDLIAIRLASLNQIIDPWAYIICRKIFISKIWTRCLGTLVGRGSTRRTSLRVLEERTKKMPRSVLIGVPTTPFKLALNNDFKGINKYIEPLHHYAPVMFQNENEKNSQLLPLAPAPSLETDSSSNKGKENIELNISIVGHNLIEVTQRSMAFSNGNHMPDENVPIPVFISEQYRIRMDCRKRRCKSKNIKKQKKAINKDNNLCVINAISDEKSRFSVSSSSSGRRHSWCCVFEKHKSFQNQTQKMPNPSEETRNGNVHPSKQIDLPGNTAWHPPNNGAFDQPVL